MKPFRDLPIQRKMLLMTLLICGAVLFVAVAALFTFQVLNFRSNFRRDTATLAAIIANNSTAAMAFKDAKAGAEVMGSLEAKPNMVAACLVAPDGALFASFGQAQDARAMKEFPPAGESIFTDGHLLYTQAVELDNKKLGMLYLRVDYYQTFLKLLGLYGLVILGVMIVSAGLALFLSGRLQRTITDPILTLARTAQKVGEQKDYSLRVDTKSRGDELGRLTESFNEMLGRIQAQDQALKESQERFEVAIAGVNDGIWDWNLKTNEVFFSPQWKRIIGYADEEIENKFSSFESLLHPDDLAPTLAVLKDYLELRGNTYSVEFRMREKDGGYRWILARGAALRDANRIPYRMAGSHTDINGRKQAEFEVHAAREKFEALVNSIDGIVWECAADTIDFRFVSRQCERILGFTPEQWLASPTFWQDHLHPDDAARAIQTCKECIARREPYSYEYRMIAAGGRVVAIRESGDVLEHDGQAELVRGIFQDITKQKQAEAELARLNSELMTVSRQAGMAEVATGVLHNVGNVLNSVSVSATLVGDRLRQSKVTNLCRATTMLREQNGHLVDFLTTDPKGKLLPDYLGAVADQLAHEQTELIAEMNSVGENIEHIKSIVAMQQNYAKVCGVLETLTLTDLVEDALRMNSAAFERHRVAVVRYYDPATPQVCVDRHKVLQVLINLMRNAKHAMDAQHAEEKRLELHVRLKSPDTVVIAVRDNGIGIAPENLTRIFGHGFTTKTDGHGFGLHSGANAAKEMGGSLSAQSEGSGHGAVFTLELPVGTKAVGADGNGKTAAN
ncbi:MAG: PAS domain S-box protein [Pedosphaera sp.]|nr:PAS domain S-box protein [Pedosphaera sp.]